MTILQVIGGVGTGSGGSGGGGTTTLDTAGVLLLIGQASAGTIPGDTAAAAACRAVNVPVVTLDKLKTDTATVAKIKADKAAMAIIRTSADAVKALGTGTVDVTDADAMTSLSQDSARLATFCRGLDQIKAMAEADVNTGTIAVLQAINHSIQLVQAVYDTVTAQNSGFTLKIEAAEDAPSSLDQYGTGDYAGNGIILCATGYWSDTSQYGLVSVNGTQVSDGTLVNTQQPNAVTRDNVGAVALPTTTFDENGDGYMAIRVYTVN